MPKREYGELEQHIITTFQNQRMFEYNRRIYEVLKAGKPRAHGGGECKTDVYAAIKKDNGKIYEIKISVKTHGSHEFEGNKATAKIAKSYFGEDWQQIICTATESLKEKFENRVLLYASGLNRIKPNSITVGWKLEFARKPRQLSTRIPLTDRQIRDYVYKGINQPQEKIDASVDGEIIKGSGVADYLLVTTREKIQSVQDIFDQMILIDEASIDDTYMIFTANNYRSDVDKADGPRALAVRIKWEICDGKLTPFFCYDEPLEYTGERDMVPYVKQAFHQLGIKNVSDIDPNADLSSAQLFRA